MKISKSIEQGIYVILMMAVQTAHAPLKSQLLSQRLEVSDSYLKKILRKLVTAGLIESVASKDGGFIIHKSVADITLYDVCAALDDLDTLTLPTLHLAAKIFPGDAAHIQRSEDIAVDAFTTAHDAYAASLKQVPLSHFLEAGSYESGVVDWRQL
ncbi:Rrf2 family transcriptional regulator [Levilactobacillus fujinensis]|uniref:Rrf2 family transcriptional regulator n=1 Tax=Levilactobacillus fujinensis TaxID=2486024 RepID=A0ABW1TGH3_9LACO|nr:Rrf2 family transcriptional regulator [Levilactobacillus fujinensis]